MDRYPEFPSHNARSKYGAPPDKVHEIVENTIFVVNEEPYVIWEADLKSRTLEFIDGIDEEYFSYILTRFLASENDPEPSKEEEKRASIAIRIAYHHALETLFSLLCCYAQAPQCPHAWIAKCSSSDLRALVEKINGSDPAFYSGWQTPLSTWQSISERVHRCYESGTAKQGATVALFATLWQKLAHEFLDQNHINEYNSLKHGFRVRSGGFSLAIGTERQYAVAPPKEKMTLMGHSEFGTTFYRLEAFSESNKRNLRSRRTSLNWNIEKVVGLLQLIFISISNVKTAFKIEHEIEPQACKFLRPTDDGDFAKPWSFSPGVTSFNFDPVLNPDAVPETSKSDLWGILEKRKAGECVR